MDLKYLTREGSWEKNPPDLQAEVLQGKRGRLLVTIYRAGGAGLHPTVLLSHGFPGIEKNFDLAQALRRIGFHVVLYHYSGSWGSDGAYAYAHNLEDADTLLEFIKTNTTYGFDKEQLFAVGHSVGGFVTAHLFAAHPELKAAVLLAPCDLGGVAVFADDTEPKRLLIDIFESGPIWLNGTSPAALYEEVCANQASYRIGALPERFGNRPVYCLGAAQDECCPPEAHCLPWVEKSQQMGGNVVYEALDTDHSFSDTRLQMIEKTAKFLAEQTLGGEIMQAAKAEEFTEIRNFYWNLIDQMQKENDRIGWKKGIYPTDEFLRDSLRRGELYILRENGILCACVILNEVCNEGYAGLPWRIPCRTEEIWIPHALAVDPSLQGRGIGRRLMAEIKQAAKQRGKKAIRLDILGKNERAESLYIGAGFRFVAAKELFYEDTGWTEYKMFELQLA